MLEQLGHDVSLAETGAEAWRRVRQERFAVVISNWSGPGLDGADLVRRARVSGVDSPYFLLVTTGDRREERANAIAAGVDDFLTRPFDRDELYSRLVVAERIIALRAELAATAAELVRCNSELERIAQLDQRNIAEIRESCRELERSHAQLMHRSITDSLTGLKNHQEFHVRLADEIDRAHRYELPLSVLMLDVDYFKHYNDQFGHPAGDEVLQRLSQLLDGQARASDTVARYGGEEFGIILPNTDHVCALAAAARIQEAVAAEPWSRRSITVSVGISTLRGAAHSRADMIDEADRALYACKRLGRNRVAHFADVLSAA